MINLIFNYGYHKIFIVPYGLDGKTLWIGSTYSHVTGQGEKTKTRKTCEQCIVELLKAIDKGDI